jgi:hypothetical protein
MGMSWEGAFPRDIGYRSFTGAQWCILLGTLRISSESTPDKDLEFLQEFDSIEDVGDLSDLHMGKLLHHLPEDDPLRGFLKQGEEGKLSPKDSAALATRLAEVIYVLTMKRHEQENSIFSPLQMKTRQFQDLQLNQIALFMWEFSAAAEKGIEIRWG